MVARRSILRTLACLSVIGAGSALVAAPTHTPALRQVPAPLRPFRSPDVESCCSFQSFPLILGEGALAGPPPTTRPTAPNPPPRLSCHTLPQPRPTLVPPSASALLYTHLSSPEYPPSCTRFQRLRRKHSFPHQTLWTKANLDEEFPFSVKGDGELLDMHA